MKIENATLDYIDFPKHIYKKIVDRISEYVGLVVYEDRFVFKHHTMGETNYCFLVHYKYTSNYDKHWYGVRNDFTLNVITEGSLDILLKNGNDFCEIYKDSDITLYINVTNLRLQTILEYDKLSEQLETTELEYDFLKFGSMSKDMDCFKINKYNIDIKPIIDVAETKIAADFKPVPEQPSHYKVVCERIIHLTFKNFNFINGKPIQIKTRLEFCKSLPTDVFRMKIDNSGDAIFSKDMIRFQRIYGYGTLQPILGRKGMSVASLYKNKKLFKRIEKWIGL